MPAHPLAAQPDSNGHPGPQAGRPAGLAHDSLAPGPEQPIMKNDDESRYIGF